MSRSVPGVDLGSPGSYLTLGVGLPVYSSDGQELGSVAHVLAEPDKDIFDGVVIDTGEGHRFVDAPQVERSMSAGWCSRSTAPRPARCPSRRRTRRASWSESCAAPGT